MPSVVYEMNTISDEHERDGDVGRRRVDRERRDLEAEQVELLVCRSAAG